MPSGFLASLSTDLVLDEGILYNNSTTPFGVSKGPLSFDPGETIQNIDFAGKRSEIALLDRFISRSPKITGTLIALNAAIAAVPLWPGSSTATVSSVVTLTPRAASTLFSSGQYATNTRAIWRKGDGTIVAVKFAMAIWTVTAIRGVSKDAAEIDVSIVPRLDLSSATDTDVSNYVIQFAATP